MEKTKERSYIYIYRKTLILYEVFASDAIFTAFNGTKKTQVEQKPLYKRVNPRDKKMEYNL